VRAADGKGRKGIWRRHGSGFNAKQQKTVKNVIPGELLTGDYTFAYSKYYARLHAAKIALILQK